VSQYTKNMRTFSQIQIGNVEVLPDHNENNILTMQEKFYIFLSIVFLFQ